MQRLAFPILLRRSSICWFYESLFRPVGKDITLHIMQKGAQCMPSSPNNEVYRPMSHLRDVTDDTVPSH